MSSEPPRLRGKSRAHRGPYPFGQFPDDVIINIGKQIVHRLAIGHADITGDDFGGIFAAAISGDHLSSPVGLTDIIWNGQSSWSAKTVQAAKPFEVQTIRLISGRNSPDYSYGITDLRADLAATGKAVLEIWNDRVAMSKNNYDDLRVVVFIRNMNAQEFAIFEYEPVRFSPGDYQWSIGPHGNLHGYEIATGRQRFTWQFHGSQFTIFKDIPGSVCKFRIAHHVGIIEPQHILRLVRFKSNWIQRVS
jgi:hypothetical protein